MKQTSRFRSCLYKSTSQKMRQARPDEVNYNAIDRFTFVHLLIGGVYYFLGLGFIWTLFLALFWELIENPLKANLRFLFPHATADTWINAIFDSLAVLIGWGILVFVDRVLMFTGK